MTSTVIIAPLVKELARRAVTGVLEKWTRYRAERFFESFAQAFEEECRSGLGGTKVDEYLAEIVEDETRSEALFDAYRYVSLSKSKTLGPRIVGFLTAKLVASGLRANDDEERIFSAAETLSDFEFLEFFKGFPEYRDKAANSSDPSDEHYMVGSSIVVRWYRETSDSSASNVREHEIGSLNMDEGPGPWAAKLKAVGLMSERVQQRIEHLHRSSFPSDELISETTTTITLTFHSACNDLWQLLVRAFGPGGSPGGREV